MSDNQSVQICGEVLNLYNKTMIAETYIKKIWADYDKEADILYMHFKKPNHADNSEITEDDIIIRYEKGEIIGLSMLNASKRLTE